MAPVVSAKNVSWSSVIMFTAVRGPGSRAVGVSELQVLKASKRG